MGTKIKGLAVETILYTVFLVLALIVITFLLMKLIPAFGDMLTNSMRSIKESFCNMLGLAGKILGC
jgi:type II secretory pathway component PulF